MERHEMMVTLCDVLRPVGYDLCRLSAGQRRWVADALWRLGIELLPR